MRRTVSWSPDMVVAYGRADPQQDVLIDYHGPTQALRADDAGWWLFATESLDDKAMPSPRP